MSEKEENNKNCRVSLVIPVYNEAENVGDLAQEAVTVFEQAGLEFEVLFVDDASTDETSEQLRRLSDSDDRVRSVRHAVNCGQSAAVATGFRYAECDWIATLEGDGQNDPADLPRMLMRAKTENADCVTGVRTNRHDTRFRKFCSRVANGFRNMITGDAIVDSGCGARIVRREALVEMPVFNGMHRFLPTLLRAQGWKILEEPVNHRNRMRGVSKYGVHNRLWRGIRDCFGVRWYRHRAFPAERVEQKDEGNSFTGHVCSEDGDPENIAGSENTSSNVSEEILFKTFQKKSRKDIYRLVLLLIIALIIFLLHQYQVFQNPFTQVRDMMESLEGGGVEVELYFGITTVLLVAIGMPRLIFFALGGLFFDFWEGLALSLIGTLGGAFLCFKVVRWAGRDWIIRRFGNHTIYKKMMTVRSSIKSVFLIRQLPISSVFLNVGFALSPVRSKTFLLGSLLGFLPQGIIATLIGSGIGDDVILESVAEFIAAALLMGAVVFISWHFTRDRRARKSEDSQNNVREKGDAVSK
ncbi:MAG: glycosyltransferase [Verrucomicrobiota bacterium]